MIWLIKNMTGFAENWVYPGELDLSVITPANNKHAPSVPQVPRWYYLLGQDHRVSLACVGQPLEEWLEPAMVIVGTRPIIGEFPLNRPLVGKIGLALKLQPASWLTGRADVEFENGQEAIDHISIQFLDLKNYKPGSKPAAKKRW